MALKSTVVEFLPEGEKLMVQVQPSGEIPDQIEKYFVAGLPGVPAGRKTAFVPLCLHQQLNIEFSVSGSGRIHKKLQDCQCRSPVVDADLKSVNHAYQEISRATERDRRTSGGSVYGNVYFEESSGEWQVLDVLRQRVYGPYEQEFERFRRIVDRQPPRYLQPLPGFSLAVVQMLEEKSEDLDQLQQKAKTLQEQVQSLSARLERTKIDIYRQRLQEFEERLAQDYPETSGTESWQEWIFSNSWLFAAQYGKPISHARVGFDSILDYLFPTADGFVDILEIKKPSDPVILKDTSHPGTHRWSAAVSAAIGQVTNYIDEVQQHRLEIAKRIEREHSLSLSIVKPRGIVLIGNSCNWDQATREGLRKLNNSLHGIRVITYYDLLCTGKNLISLYHV